MLNEKWLGLVLNVAIVGRKLLERLLSMAVALCVQKRRNEKRKEHGFKFGLITTKNLINLSGMV